MVDTNYISQIEGLQRGELPSFNFEALDKLCKDYPCFQSAFLLKAIHLKQNDNNKFEEELPAVAVRVLNRSVLYDRVNETYRESKPSSVDQVIEIPEVEDVVDGELNEIIEKAKVLHAEEAPLVESPIQEDQAQITDEQDDLKALVAEINRKRKEAPILTKSPKTKVKPIVKPKAKKKKTAPKQLKTKKQVPEAQINSFTDWLKHKKSVDASTDTEDTAKPLIPIDMALRHEAELMRDVKKSNLKLEDFLVGQIERIQNKKKEGHGLTLHAVSETYAQILVSQDKINEAIDVYKELSIKYPKKSSNFARQIENLKNS